MGDLVLKSAVGSAPLQVPDSDDGRVVYASPGDVVTIEITTDPAGQSIHDSLGWTKDNLEWVPANAGGGVTYEAGEGAIGKVTLKITAIDDLLGKYVVTGTVGGVQATADITISRQSDGGLLETPDGTVAEVAIGEYDPLFAILWAVPIVTVGGFVAWTLLDTIRSIKLPAQATEVAADTVLDGAFADRVASMGYLVAFLGGLLLLITGAYLGILEVRGRQRSVKVKPTDDTRGLVPDAVKGTFEAASELLESSKLVRATPLVLVVGVLVLALGIFGAARESDPPMPSPSTTVPTTAAPETRAPGTTPTVQQSTRGG